MFFLWVWWCVSRRPLCYKPETRRTKIRYLFYPHTDSIRSPVNSLSLDAKRARIVLCSFDLLVIINVVWLLSAGSCRPQKVPHHRSHLERGETKMTLTHEKDSTTTPLYESAHVRVSFRHVGNRTQGNCEDDTRKNSDQLSKTLQSHSFQDRKSPSFSLEKY